MERSLTALELVLAVAERGNTNSASDAGVAGLMGYAAAQGAYYNILINLNSISDEEWITKIKKNSDDIMKKAKELSDKITKTMLFKLKA